MSPLTHALICYWKRLPSESAAVRARCLESACERVSRRKDPRAVLLPYALGDSDEDIVAAATRAYVQPSGEGAQLDTGATSEAADWIRRGLALNRGAVFGALLSIGGEAVLGRLAGLRLGLSAAEVDTACRVLGRPAGAGVVDFLAEWVELTEDGPSASGQRALLAVLDGRDCAQAA
jgi:hypothetical protein